MDNHHVQIWPCHSSCGIIELSNLTSDPAKVLYAIANHLYHPARGAPAAIVVWSDVVDGNGEKLFALIESLENLLSWKYRVWKTDPWENPKTSNMCVMYQWEIPHESLKEWYIEARVCRARRL